MDQHVRFIKRSKKLLSNTEYLFGQAELRIVRGSTNERKQMSTKTTFKRIALVAVAALGFGMLSVVPSNAAAPAYTVTAYATTPVNGVSATAATAIAGPANYVAITNTDAALSAYVTVTGGTFTDGTVAKTVAGTTPSASVFVSTPTAGTITVKITQIAANGVADTTNTATLTITVIPALAGTVYASSTVTATTGAAAAAAKTAFTYTNTDGVVSRWAAGAVSVNAAYQFDIAQFDATPVAMATASSKAVTATLAGPGALTIESNAVVSAPAPYVALAAGGSTNGLSTVKLYSDGRAGETTLTISVNGSVVKTYKVVFYGSVAKYTVTSTENYINSNNTGSFTVTALDSLGTPVHSAAWVAKSSAATTIASVTGAGTTSDCGTDGVCTAGELAALGTSTGVTTAVVGGLGVATITAGNADYSISATDTVEVTGATAASISVAFDKSNVAAGESAYLVVTVKDANGKPYADGVYNNIFSAVTIDGLTWWNNIGTQVTLADGVFKTSYAQGLANTTISTTFTVASGATIASALRGTSIVAKTVVDVDNSVAAAADAAAEATDAANAATDAANAAAEAADAATAAAQDAADAVAALSTQVAEMITALKKQITALTNLVIKIQKKVKA